MKRVSSRESFEGKKVTVMGLGLNGGGLASVRYFCNQGAIVTATDLRSAEILKPSIDKLSDLDVTYRLESHEMQDFADADIVIKNPAVSPDSPYLKAASRVETDISIFLAACKNPIFAVTGSKGKSTLVSALYHILKEEYPGVKLGGNITVSPLTFINQLGGGDPVILELSSWQLGDLRGRNLLHPEVSVITNIMNDHQNSYDSFEDYVDDKREIYRGQTAYQKSIFNDDERGKSFAEDSKSQSILISTENLDSPLLPEKLLVPGKHFRQNCLFAAHMAEVFGMRDENIRAALAHFPGVKDRMELVHQSKGLSFYNDTTATIPEALVAAVKSFEDNVQLICGGSDKELSFEVCAEAFKSAKSINLFEGNGSDKMITVLKENNIPYNGPFPSMQTAVDSALSESQEGDIILLSPGATSFGMFLNEFDRGNQFKAIVQAL